MLQHCPFLPWQNLWSQNKFLILLPNVQVLQLLEQQWFFQSQLLLQMFQLQFWLLQPNIVKECPLGYWILTRIFKCHASLSKMKVFSIIMQVWASIFSIKISFTIHQELIIAINIVSKVCQKCFEVSCKSEKEQVLSSKSKYDQICASFINCRAVNFYVNHTKTAFKSWNCFVCFW